MNDTSERRVEPCTQSKLMPLAGDVMEVNGNEGVGGAYWQRLVWD